MTLAEYLDQEGLSITEFAERIDVTHETVRRYVAGQRLPRRAVMKRIAEATDGAVTANDLFAHGPLVVGKGSEGGDTMRPEYDFSGGMRGVTAQRYAQGANVVVISPEVLDVFPDGAAVNEALRALAPVLRRSREAER